MRIIKKKNEKSLIREFLQIFKREIDKKKKSKSRLSFVLTGGSSPVNLYKKLAKSNIDWSNIDLFWGDERFVSNKSKNSNFKLANDLFIKKVKIKKQNLFYINTKRKDINQSSVEYQNKIKNYFKNKKIKFDICLLGMGNDGHVASIFPNTNILKKKSIVSPVNRGDFKRITIGLKVINNSKKIFLWLSKKSKTSIFKKLRLKGKKIPINNLNKKKLYCFLIN
tara:strand:- start:75 stop:743 length:669 start_codon:yes stop_codon:yes gene_type:complete